MKRKVPLHPGRISGTFQRILVFFFLWCILTGGHPEALWVGVPVALVAAGVSIAVHPARYPRWSIKGALQFLPFFLWQSWEGGVDVARRVFHPGLPISPSLLTYSLRLPDERSRIFFAGTLSLLPGTLSAEMEGDRVRLHVLDDRQPILGKLQTVEERVAALFGTDPAPGSQTPWGGGSS